MSEGLGVKEPSLLTRARRWHGGLDLLGRQRLYVSVALGLLLAGLLIFLNEADAPWQGKAPKLLARSQFAEGAPGYLRNIPTEYFAQVHLWKAAAINACLVALLLATCRWWVRWAFVPKVENLPRIGRPVSKLSIFFLLGAIVLSCILRIPLLDRQILRDEQDTLRRSIHGYTDVMDDGTEIWRPTSWHHTFHENRLANNPILLSVTARACLELWRAATGLPDDRSHLIPIRLPSLIASLASIILIWRLLHWLGFRCAALFAAFFMALHPTAIDFAVQARGYSLCMFFELLAITSVYLALRTLRWRWWVVYGASIMLCLYSYPGAIYFAIGFNIFLGLYLLRRILRAKTRAAAWPQFVRCGVSNLIAAIVFLQLAKPAIAQASEYLHRGVAKIDLHADWVFACWTHMTSGVPLPTSAEWWDVLAEEDRHLTDYIFNSFLPTDPILAFFTLVLSPALLAFGAIRLLRGNRFASPIVFGGLAAPVLAYAHTRLITHLHFHTWYLIYFLPVFILLFSIGITSIAMLFKNTKRRPYIILATGTAYLVIFSFVTGPEGGNGRDPRYYGRGEPYGEFQRGKSRWRYYPDGKTTREYGKEIDRSKLQQR